MKHRIDFMAHAAASRCVVAPRSSPWLRRLTPVVSVAVLCLLNACAVTAPNPPTPATPPAQYKESALWQRAAAQPATVPDQWWELFNDPVLNRLEERLATDNETIRTAIAKVVAAKAQLTANQSALQPTLSLSTGETRSVNASGVPGVLLPPGNLATLGATAGWDADLWGRLSKAVTAAQASWQASVDDLAAARLSVQAMLAQGYLSLRMLEAQQQVLDRTVVAYQRTLDLTRERYKSGVAQESDVLQAQTQLNTAQV